MATTLNRFEKWMLKRIARKTVIQGWHRGKIEDYYIELFRAATEEFTEDNKPTLATFLTECHRESLNAPTTPPTSI